MANTKISALTSATTPLAGTEVLPIVQSSATVKVATNDLTVRNIRANATTGILQVTGPAAASTRIATVPDANFTVARTDAAQSFTGDQTLSTGNVVIGTSGKGVTTGSAIPLGFGTNGSTSQGLIDTSGNVIIGTTTALGKLTVTQGASSNTDTIALLAATAAGAGSQPGLKFYNSSSAAKAYMFWDTNTDRTYVQTGATGGVYLANGGTSWTSASDERLKDIIEPITDAVNKVSTLRAVIGKYKTDEEGTRRSLLIAQDVQAVLPEAVSSGCMPASDDPTEYLGVAYTEVIPLLVAAIKEQQVTIENLKSRLDSANI
jgi:hypothetical protein